MNTKIWTKTQIYLASYLGGPFAGCFLIGNNYKKLGRQDTAKKSYWLGALGTLALLIITLFIPEQVVAKVPKIIIPIALSSIVAAFAEYFQEKEIKAKLAEGAKRHSYWLCIAIGLLFTAATLLLLFCFFLAYELFFS